MSATTFLKAAHLFLRAAPRGLSVAVLIAFIILNGLGAWQLQRLSWKQHLTTELARTETQPPVAVDTVLASEDPAWRAVTLPPCDIVQDRLVTMNSVADGQSGYRVLAACPAGAGTILVDLGFAIAEAKPNGNVKKPVGRLRAFEKPGLFTPPNNPVANDWYWRSAAEMGPALKASSLRDDYFVVLDLKESDFAAAGLQQGAMIAPLTNRHLEYALTWFALAWTLLFMFVAFVLERLKKV
ncbi:SURF1 family protein [Asticcacaulis sp. AC402]|uniref:SURF1 family protein n=1 Tax=Asticcacaulis sp. AC402 TaxID=1282361 RepID=UPI0003C3D091|nr:SURF1 family protein [Asticcacaulis sp. AC402]ESQ74473.1 hypothetical protein ABAC402_14235 [Asticcacaulis sp. AC402]